MKYMAMLAIVLALSCISASGLEPSSLWSTYPASRWNLLTTSQHAIISEPLSTSDDVFAPDWVVEIFARLNYRVTADLKNATIFQATELMRDILRCNVIISNEALTCDREFNLRVKAMRGELFLDWMCRLTDADWEIRDEAVFVYMKSERARFDEGEKTIEEIITEELEKEYVPPDFVPEPFPTENHND